MIAPAGCCARCGCRIDPWQFNGPTVNDLTTQGPEMHTSCYQAEAKETMALGDEPREMQERFGRHLQRSPAVLALLAKRHTWTKPTNRSRQEARS